VLGGVLVFVTGMAATMGSASDSSIIESRASPISFDTGIVNREAGRRIRGWGNANTESFEVAMAQRVGVG
jgi:hypothetical protein